jgi:hypothetical protein
MSPAPKKKDPSITFLNKFGYNVVKLPRTGIEPMDVIGRDTVTQWLGPISRVWTSGSPEPQPGPPNPAIAVNGQRTDSLDLSLGLSVLASTLAAFGASVPSLNVAYQRASSVQFTYSDVTSTSVAPFDAGNYLAEGTLSTNNPVVKNYFFGENAKAYLIVEVLKSTSITVTATDSHGLPVEIDIPALEGVVSGKVGVKPSSDSKSTITFTGTVPVTFGFSVQQIAREGDAWTLHGAAPGGDIAFAGPGFGMDQPAEETPNPLIFDTGDNECRLEMEFHPLS